MSDLLETCPGPGAWRVDWTALQEAFPWVHALHVCPQDPSYHGEGDVGVHTRMVLEAMASLESFRALSERDRKTVYLACLLHDVAKPATTIQGADGRWTSPAHARKGAIRSRRLLYELAVPFALREAVVALVHHHEVPFYLVDRDDAERVALRVSQTARCDLLALVAQADALGRICAEQGRLLDQIALFREMCVELGCWQEPFRFPSDHSRFEYFRVAHRSPRHEAFDDTRATAVILSGLPGAGKDRWVEANAQGIAVVSLDDIRRGMGVSPKEQQGSVAAAAREMARTHLRRGEGFVWNATNVSRDVRQACIALAADYRARVRVVYLEVPLERLRKQNREREHPAPEDVIDRLLDRWQIPDLTEAHQVELVVED
ncbi:MAG: AAA family ATPase [Deltaproteobacteria bacterium]|nr:AAA family ATPase [Deltaproteobacteria bacterium]